ncbi:MAG: hypothetical protein D6744_10000, partial [Planctomycetota bacterium]
GIYITAGGQTAVIFTDLAQGFILLLAGLVLLVLGLDYLALDGTLLSGLKTLWANLSLSERLPFADFNRPQDFNFIGVFWQDGIAGSITFLFISQGLIMRFMAAKSVNEGRKAILFNTAFILPLSMIVVGCAGWLANAMVDTGRIAPPEDTRDVFVIVAETVCRPGVFGFVLAALSAALMSTIDTLTNATAALFIYDIYQPYVRRGASDRHYMNAARITSAATALIGMGVGLWFATQGADMYKLHGMFQAFVTPPIVAAVFMGAFWKRFTNAGAIAALAGGMTCIGLSKIFPDLVAPLAHGVEPDKHGQYNYMTACFGLVCAGVIGAVVSLFTKPKSEAQLAGLWIGSVDIGLRRFKGGDPNYDVGRKVTGRLRVTNDGVTGPTIFLTYADYVRHGSDPPQSREPHEDAAHVPDPEYSIVRLSSREMERLKAKPGDLVYVEDRRWWLGGLRSLHARAGEPHDEPGMIWVSPEALEYGSLLADRPVRVEKLL